MQVGSLAELAGAVLSQVGGLLEVPAVPLAPETIFSPPAVLSVRPKWEPPLLPHSGLIWAVTV